MTIAIPKISMAAARVNAGLSQNAAAEALHISRSTMIRYETGETIPSWEMVKAIENLYGYPADYIFFGKK